MARVNKPVYMADFETVVSTNCTRVWLWGIANFNNENIETGTDITTFMDRISKISCKCYFHNLKFDSQFILYWLLTNGFRHVTSRELHKNQFNTLISDAGVFYTIKVKFENDQKVEFYDSLKILPMSVAEMPEAFGLDIKKLDMDYEEVRDINHIPTEEEINYIKHDLLVPLRCIKIMHDRGLTRMTTASNALYNYKHITSVEKFNELYPPLTLSEDRDCRLSYKGGWTYLNPKYADMLLDVGQVYDVNSMYPWAMKYCLLPYGHPIYYSGKYDDNDEYPLYIQCLRCEFKLKKERYPSIQLKGNIRFMDTEYVVDSEGPEILTLTSVDLKLLYENYIVSNEEWIGGYKFKGMYGLFTDYIDYWYEEKNKAKHEGNKPMQRISKLMLNSLYGKFGSNPRKKSKYPYYDKEKDIVRYEIGVEEITSGGYVPVASFITSYCRDKIVRAANLCGDSFVYADTDSIHIIGDTIPEIEIDEYKLGAFKQESVFKKAKFHRAKCYIEEIDGKLNKKCAGLPKLAKEKFNFDTMNIGEEFEGKLVPVNVPGGVTLVDRKFTIK